MNIQKENTGRLKIFEENIKLLFFGNDEKKRNSWFAQNLIILIGLCGVLTIVTLLYSNHFNNPFHFDDFHTIVSNEYIRDLGNTFLFFKDAATTSSHPNNQAYRPLTTLSLAVDYWLGGTVESTFYFQLSTFFWYLIILIMFFFLFRKIAGFSLQNKYNGYIALFATLWYGVHTANAETINYIISRTDVLSTAMVVIALFIFIYYPAKRKFYLYMIPVIAGMFMKETTAVFPALAFSYLVLFEYKWKLSEVFQFKNFIKAIKPVFLSLVVCGALALLVVNMMSENWTVGNISRVDYLITQFFVIVHYFNTFFLPFNLSADTDWTRITNVFDDRVLIGFLFIVSLIYIAFKTSEKQEYRPVSFGILWFFFALLPTSSIIPLSEVMNDHRIFFPFIGLMISTCWGIYSLIVKNENVIGRNIFLKYATMIFLSAIICAHAYGTRHRNYIWSNDELLWKDVSEKSPNNGRGLMNYGLALMRRGDYEGAQKYFEKALTLTPYYSYLHINMGILKGAMNKNDEAEKYFKSGIQYSQNNPEHYFFYATWLRKQNRINESISHLERALQISPGHVSSKNLLKELRLIEGKTSLEIAEEKVKSSPTAVNYINLSLEYYYAKRFDDCIKACEEALKQKPDYDIAYNNICSCYNAMQKWDAAIAACEKGLKINSGNQLMKNNLELARKSKQQKNTK